jgi:thymidylate synthase ThyX
MQHLDAHDVPLRELEYCTYTFDLVMDQGAYAEFKRHRMMTQTAQKLGTRLGYAVPQLIVEAGMRPQYEAAMQSAAEVYEKLFPFNPDVAQYVVPNGYKRRVLARFNLREAYAFCQLRAAPNAHFSIRRIARQIHDAIRQVHPRLAAYMRLPEESADGLLGKYFAEG